MSDICFRRNKALKKKITRYLLGIVLTALVVTVLILVMIFHRIYRKQAVGNMKEQTRGLARILEEEDDGLRWLQSIENSRFTWIAPDGTVRYDSTTEAAEMENHLYREEVQEALTKGEGYALRRSDTLGAQMYYYALRLENGDILRNCREEASIWKIFYDVVIGIALVVIIMSVLCMLSAGIMTDRLIEPIDRMAADIDHAVLMNPYTELIPFVRTIQHQHEEIVRGADMRQEFTANVSHELKTPLTSISGYAELIEAGFAGEKEVIRFAGEIKSNAQRLLTLINDIIRLSELDSGQAEPAFEKVDLYETAGKVLKLLEFQFRKSRIRPQLQGERTYIHASKEMMEELIFNLADNAIRYNKAGGKVTIEVCEEEGQVILSVRDTGIGIPPDSRERIFERFYRVDKSRSKATGGTGLGLAIVKHIVGFHHARMEVDSEMGIGTTMRVIFASCKEGAQKS